MIITKQISAREVSLYRKMYATKQGYKCAICSGSLAGTVQCLDHDHKTGQLRGTLCGTCNRAEGKVLKAATYLAKHNHLARINVVSWLIRMVKYIQYYDNNPTGILHHTFDPKTGKQRPKKRKKK